MYAPKPDISRPSTNPLLSTYIQFLGGYGKYYNASTVYDTPIDFPFSSAMAAIFDKSNPASPLAYTASQTALFLLDFQGFIVDRLGPSGQAALAKAKVMRDWALKQHIMVVHSVVDATGKTPSTCKGAERITKMLADVADDRSAAEEPSDIAFSQSDGEYIVLKHPGFVSALKSTGAVELLKDHGIRNLILCGLSTSGAVLRTAMPATDEGFVVSVVEDGCADPNEALHELLMKTVLPSRAHIASAEEFIGEWGITE